MTYQISTTRDSARRYLKAAMEFAMSAVPDFFRRKGRLILAYHGVKDSGSSARGERTLHIDAAVFEEHLAVLRRSADIVPLNELLSSNDSKDRLVAITFDDAYASALRNGASLCRLYQLPYTVFVAPALLGRVPKWDVIAETRSWSASERDAFLSIHVEHGSSMSHEVTEETAPLRIATTDELRNLLATDRFATIGNHTYSHRNLGILEAQDVRFEITHADSWLRSFDESRYLPFVAYPFGIPPIPSIRSTLDGEGVVGILARGGWIKEGFESLPTLIPRWNVPADVSKHGFRSRILRRLT